MACCSNVSLKTKRAIDIAKSEAVIILIAIVIFCFRVLINKSHLKKSTLQIYIKFDLESQSIAKSKKRHIKNTFFINEFDNSITIQNFNETFTLKFLL